jgi:predicted nucleic acid-binding protein
VTRAEVADTSVFIHVLRDQRREAGLYQRLIAGRLWLPSIAALELYAGARGRDEGRGLDRLVRAMARNGRLLTPTHAEWIVGGQLIARANRLYGLVRPRDHVADVLITLVAARLSGAVLTAAVAHFERWAELARDSGRDVTVIPFAAAAD